MKLFVTAYWWHIALSSSPARGGITGEVLFCGNNQYFQFMVDGENRDCLWVRDQSDQRKYDICTSNEIESNCELSCGSCCEDNPFYRLQVSGGEDLKSCHWIGMKIERTNIYCNLPNEQGVGHVKDMCPVACAYCASKEQPTEMPTSSRSPSQLPTKAYSMLPSSSPSSYPSDGSTMKSTESHTRTSTSLPTMPPMNVSEIAQSNVAAKKSNQKSSSPYSGFLLIFAGVILVIAHIAFAIRNKQISLTQTIREDPNHKEEPISSTSSPKQPRATTTSTKSMSSLPSVVCIKPPSVVYIPQEGLVWV